MPAKTRRYRSLKRKKPAGNKFLLFIVSAVVIISVALLSYVFIGQSIWRSGEKLLVGIQKVDGSVDVVVFDPIAERITTLTIPATTELELAYGLGKWRLRSVWQLGENEKIGGGTLLTKSLRKQFFMPIYAWSDEESASFLNGNYLDLFRSFFNHTTNLTLKDKFRLVKFSLQIGSVKRSEKSLANTTMLTSQVLKDGEEGYVVTGNIPKEFYSLFSLVTLQSRSKIVNQTNSVSAAENIASTLEVFGSKVVAIEGSETFESNLASKYPDDYCVVVAEERTSLVDQVVKVFDCKLVGAEEDGSGLDLILVLNPKFEGIY